MSFLLFLAGFVMMAVGFMMVWQTAWFDENWGDIGAMFGLKGSSLEHWKFGGIILLFLGFLIAFGIFQAFFNLTIGQFLPNGQR
ncbi:MAG TPA: hypothetical protein VLG69_00555 [Candidatus Andersenbacteria bacterium]|nr:hypothetical protein [Candidatus Andersenbacteria bacterium]